MRNPQWVEVLFDEDHEIASAKWLAGICNCPRSPHESRIFANDAIGAGRSGNLLTDFAISQNLNYVAQLLECVSLPFPDEDQFAVSVVRSATALRNCSFSFLGLTNSFS